jgi:cytochrome c
LFRPLPPSAALAGEPDRQQNHAAGDKPDFDGERVFSGNGPMKLQQPMRDDVVDDAKRAERDQGPVEHGVVAWLHRSTCWIRRPRGCTKPFMSVRAFGCLILLGIAAVDPSHAAGDVERGARLARSCMACHSFAPGRHLTGPSLAGVWGRKAGTAAGFGRYSEALKGADVVWNEQKLDAWIKNPAALVPGNTMVFDGIADAGARGDLLAYLRAVSEGRVAAPDHGLPSLKGAADSRRVTAIRYCGDAYRVTTADRKTQTWWEFNLRFKTDGSASGPAAGQPVIVGTGMQGDRAAVVFSRPEEMSTFIRRECP